MVSKKQKIIAPFLHNTMYWYNYYADMKSYIMQSII